MTTSRSDLEEPFDELFDHDSKAGPREKQTECLDCYKQFEATDCNNASLVTYEYNPACPFCGGDNLKF